ncbi:LOW QUALITY PROTEIN: olfactory receptor 2G3-like [Cavia porcellus]|uniref:LOW QUALITY PROTEIN: olfactory receptor 2G3-like n=1 Tax=Cavia porcellus TaxID=10141 RepID=UPI002FE07198
METSDGSLQIDFILLGFSDRPQLEPINFHLLYGVVFICFMVTLVGNSTIIIVSYLDPQLHTPMYFFLSNLSLLKLGYTNSIIPQMLANLWGPNKAITYVGCFLQFFFALVFAATETLLLTVMAYDRYAAVCQPLHYTVIMHPRLCQKMGLICWLGGLRSAITVCSGVFTLPRCGQQELDSFICETPALMKLACAHTREIQIAIFVFGFVFLLPPISLIFISYRVTTQAVMRMHSAATWRKILTTCGSHLTVVVLFFVPAIYTYMTPQNTTSQEEGKFFTLFYTIITPSHNPLIHTLRNKDVETAIKKILLIKTSVKL